MAKLHVCEVCKAFEYLEVIRYISLIVKTSPGSLAHVAAKTKSLVFSNTSAAVWVDKSKNNRTELFGYLLFEGMSVDKGI